MRAWPVVVPLALVGVLACHGVTDSPVKPDVPMDPQVPVPVDPVPLPVFSAYIYGSDWKANDIAVRLDDEHGIEITGVAIQGPLGGYHVALQLKNATGPGQYLLGVEGNGSIFSIRSDVMEWNTHWGAGTGLAIVTYLDAHRIVGRFEADTDSEAGAVEMLNAARGTFDIIF